MAKSNALPAGPRRRSAGKARESGRIAAPSGHVDARAPGRLAESRRAALALDRVIHERTRLGIVSALAVNPALTFTELKRLLQTTDGNLSVHARKLEQAEYLTCTKFFEGRVPRTEYRLTAEGRRALEDYLAHMEALIRVTRSR